MIHSNNLSISDMCNQIYMLDFLRDFHPAIYPVKGRIKAAWRDGDGLTVQLHRHHIYDHKLQERLSPFDYLEKYQGYSKADAANYLKRYLGISDDAKPFKRSSRPIKSARIDSNPIKDDESIKQKEIALKSFERTIESFANQCQDKGHSAYLERKGVMPFFDSHSFDSINLTGSDKSISVARYGKDKRGAFIIFAISKFEGTIIGFQKIYDEKFTDFSGNLRDKDFSGQKKSGAVHLYPLAFRDAFSQGLPSAKKLATLIKDGLEVAFCEGIATGMSIAMAKPKAWVICALDNGNLEHCLAEFRAKYPKQVTIKAGKGKREKIAIIPCIWADDDRAKSGAKTLSNVNLWALEYGCTIRLPNVKGLDKATDFNDVMLAKGINSVKSSRILQPDTKIAFAEDLAKIEFSSVRDLPKLERLPANGTALLVKSNKGTGKTKNIMRSAIELAKAAGLAVLLIGHRRALLEASAKELGLHYYLDSDNNLDLISCDALAISYDSLHRLGHHLPHFDLIIIDESEQVAIHATSEHIKKKAASFKVFKHYLAYSQKLILLDADSGGATHALLDNFAADKKKEYIKHSYAVGTGKSITFTYDKDDLAADALEHNEPIYYMCNSLGHARGLNEMLIGKGKRTLLIASETASNPDVKAYLKNPSIEALKYDVILATPSAQTGISDESGNAKVIYGRFSNANGTYQDALQALARARKADDIRVWVDSTKNPIKSENDFRAHYHALADNEAKGLGAESVGIQDDDYIIFKSQVASQVSFNRANKKLSMAKAVTLEGYEVSYELPSDVSPDILEARADLRASLKQLDLNKYAEDRANAATISDAKAKELEQKAELSQDEQFSLERFHFCDFYRVKHTIKNDELKGLMIDDNKGKIKAEIICYEDALRSDEDALNEAKAVFKGEILKGDLKPILTRHELFKRLALAVGLTPDLEVYAEKTLARIDELKGKLETEKDILAKAELSKELKGLSHLAPFTYSKDSLMPFIEWARDNRDALGDLISDEGFNDPVRFASTLLRKMGLKHERCDRSGKNDAYALDLNAVLAKWHLSRPRRIKPYLCHEIALNRDLYEFHGKSAENAIGIVQNAFSQNNVCIQDSVNTLYIADDKTPILANEEIGQEQAQTEQESQELEAFCKEYKGLAKALREHYKSFKAEIDRYIAIISGSIKADPYQQQAALAGLGNTIGIRL